MPRNCWIYEEEVLDRCSTVKLVDVLHVPRTEATSFGPAFIEDWKLESWLKIWTNRCWILNRDGIDLEHLPLEEVFEQLRTSARGLSSDDAECRLHIFVSIFPPPNV
ncbi:putative proton-exporting ATPase [Rosa chinensis]|uniref:Putative proton-exporting ATPase n=1 Tax=Rosa chinensis TaxID=74649 RepID=A0A2P6RV47_ROSCH|nr:putative proton-exporting ATPase [Rosa chinensis]